MPIGWYRSTITGNQGNMAPPEPSYLTTASPGYSNSAEAQENDPKTNFVEIFKV